MTKLDEIITAEAKKFSAPLRPEGLNLLIYNVALEFAKHILEEAADNAEVKVTENALIEEGSCYTTYDDGVISVCADKQSITDTLNKYL